MKKSVKLIILVIVFGLLFLYRAELHEIAGNLFADSSDILATEFWQQREEALQAANLDDLVRAITLLSGYEKAVSIELERKPRGEKSHKCQADRKKLVCELGLINRKLAEEYLQDGNAEAYSQSIERSNSFFKECGNTLELHDDSGLSSRQFSFSPK